MSKTLVKCAVAPLIALALSCGKVYEEPEPPPRVFELPVGTKIAVDLKPDGVASTLEPGDPFEGVLAASLQYRWEAVDPEGEPYERMEIVAPEGAPVAGEVVEEKSSDGEVRNVLRLTTVFFRGGESFPVTTAPIRVPEEPEGGEAQPLMFELTEPADVSVVIEYQLKDEDENSG